MGNQVLAMSAPAIENVRRLEKAAAELPQVSIETEHAFHAGLYARTVRIPAGVVITGALIRIATVLIVSGEAVMYGEDGPETLSGYNVLSASAGRKQAFVALSETYLTMLFATDAKTVAEAESEFTVETDLLVSRRSDAINTFGRELECPG